MQYFYLFNCFIKLEFKYFYCIYRCVITWSLYNIYFIVHTGIAVQYFQEVSSNHFNLEIMISYETRIICIITYNRVLANWWTIWNRSRRRGFNWNLISDPLSNWKSNETAQQLQECSRKSIPLFNRLWTEMWHKCFMLLAFTLRTRFPIGHWTTNARIGQQTKWFGTVVICVVFIAF